MGFLGIEPE